VSSGSGVTVHPGAVLVEQVRAAGPVVGGLVDRPADRGWERDKHHFGCPCSTRSQKKMGTRNQWSSRSMAGCFDGISEGRLGTVRFTEGDQVH
jgi:hypothetical protein